MRFLQTRSATGSVKSTASPAVADESVASDKKSKSKAKAKTPAPKSKKAAAKEAKDETTTEDESAAASVFTGPDGLLRCGWCNSSSKT